MSCEHEDGVDLIDLLDFGVTLAVYIRGVLYVAEEFYAFKKFRTPSLLIFS